MFMPFVVKAEENSCEKVNTASEKTVEIMIKQEIGNKEELSLDDIKKAKFTYKILDLEDNVLAETTNDEDGNIIFDCFSVKSYDIGNYKLYKIIMESHDNSLFDYDPYIIYFSVRPNYTDGLFDPIIAYYKDDGDDSPERYGLSYKGKVFHATDEELQGKAYAEIDTDTGIMTFFRDEEGKYTNRQEIGNKTYYTDFEDSTNFGWERDSDKYIHVKKIVFKDAVKPIEIESWFYSFTQLEEADISKLDTSLVSRMSRLFMYCYNLKNVDISTMDLSNVHYIDFIFQYTQVEYFNLSYWNLNGLNGRYDFNMAESFSRNSKLKYLDISNLRDWSSSNDFYKIPCLEKIVLGNDYAFTNTFLDVDVNYPIWYSPNKNEIYNSSKFKYLGDLSGYYIRPMCTTTASFRINYIPPKTDNSKNVTDILTNPNTKIGTYEVAIIGLLAITIFIVSIVHDKRKEN